MVKISDIAEKVGVSKGTVSKALNGATDISETLRNKIIIEAQKMGYLKDDVKKLCILIQNTNYKQKDDFAYDMINGFKQLAKKEKYNVVIVKSTLELQNRISFNMFMKENEFIGCFVIGFSYNDIWLNQFKESKYPCVLYDNKSDGSKTTSQVGVDSNEAMELIIEHLHKFGHKNIAYLGGELGSYYSKSRFEAFKRALNNYDIEFNSLLYGEHFYVSECVSTYLPVMLENNATAIVCGHDLLANATMIQCQEMGYSIPNDISVVGFDNLPFAALTDPPLTTICQNRLQIGKSAYYAMESLLNDIYINSILIHANLIIRQSTAKIK